MMKRFAFLFLLLPFGFVLSHVSLQYPYPRDTLNGQSYEVWQQNEPVISIHRSTCHGLDKDSKIRNGNTFNALDIIEIDLYGSSIHDGGHCSFWYSTDQTYFTKIIDIADCTLYADSTDNGIQVLLPQTMPQVCNESCIFAWSFIPYKSQSCQMYMNCADIRVVNTISNNTNDESIIINFDTMISNSDCDFVNDSSHFSTTFGQIKTKYTYNEIGLNGNKSVSLATIISSNLLSDTNSLSITIDETEISNNIENDNSTDSSNILCANPNANNIDGIIDYQGTHLSFCGSLCTSTDSDGNENCRCEDGQCCSKSGICGPILIRYSTSYDTSLSKTVYTPLYRNYTYTTSYDSGSYYITQHDNGYYASETLAFKDYCDDLSSENDDWRLIECSSIDDTSDNDNDDDDNNSDLLFDLENINIFTVFILIILVLVGIVIVLIIIYYVRQVLCKDKFNKTKDMLNNVKNTNNNIERDDAGTPPSGPIQHGNSHNNNNRDTLAMDNGNDGSGGEPIDALPQNMQTNEMYDGKNIELAISNEIDMQKQKENEMQAEQDRLYAHNVLMGELIDAPMSQAPLPPKANNIEKNEKQQQPQQRALQQVGKQNDKKSQNNKNNKKNRKKSSSIVNTSDKHGFIQSPKKIRKQTGFKQRFMSIFKKEGQDDDDDDIEDLYDPADAAAAAAGGVDNAVAPPAAQMSQGGSIASVVSFDAAAAAINAVEAAPSMPAPMVPDNDKQVNDNNNNKEENDFTEFEGRDNDDGNEELALNDDNISNNNASILAFAQYRATNDPNYNSNDENDDNDINCSSYDKARSIASGSTSRDTRGTRGTRGTRSSRTSGIAGGGLVNVPRQPFFDKHKSTENNVNVMNNIEEQAENMDNENDNALLNDGNAAGGEAEGI